MKHFFIAATALILAGAPASAHALLDHAVPAVGSTVRTAPRSITLWFTQKVEAASSSVEVRNSTGGRVDVGKPRAAGDGSMLTVGLKALPAGTYQVRWRVRSVDAHATEGDFAFTVGQ